MIQKKGWTNLYQPYFKSKDQGLPELQMGQEIPVTKLSTKRQYTKPPTRYNASSLIRKMEQEKIGTKATRSNIVDTLAYRGYIKGQSISITELGEKTIETLERYCPEIIQVKLTRDLEEELARIEVGKKDAGDVFDEVVDELKPILSKFKENEVQIGRSLSSSSLMESGTGCKICGREKLEGSVFCKHHHAAYENLETGFQRWRYALGYQWLEYLEKLAKVSGTGGFAEEIINNILG
jgi:DNA topoisomerase-1